MEARATSSICGGKSSDWTCTDQACHPCSVDHPWLQGHGRTGPGELRWHQPTLFPAPPGVRSCPPRLGHLYHRHLQGVPARSDLQGAVGGD
eukprot:3894132-Prorocentrum_lima.AAC.1